MTWGTREARKRRRDQQQSVGNCSGIRNATLIALGVPDRTGADAVQVRWLTRNGGSTQLPWVAVPMECCCARAETRCHRAEEGDDATIRSQSARERAGARAPAAAVRALEATRRPRGARPVVPAVGARPGASGRDRLVH